MAYYPWYHNGMLNHMMVNHVKWWIMGANLCGPSVTGGDCERMFIGFCKSIGITLPVIIRDAISLRFHSAR